MSDIFQRSLSSCHHKASGTNCKICGVYFHPENQALKTNLFDSYWNCSSQKFITNLRKRQAQPIQSKQISQGTWNILQNICEKFQYSTETLALGIYIYAKTNSKLEREQKFWASAALLVASKAIQLDKKVPYLNRYQKYADKSFSQEEYETAERTIFEQMKFNLQITTFISFIHFYMTNGFLFQKDSLQIHNVKLIEDQLLYKAKQMMKNASFLHYQPQKLALSLVKEVRIKHRLDPWNSQLQKITEAKGEDISVIQKSNILKPLCTLSMRAKQKLSSISQHNTIISSLQNSAQLLDNKPKLVRRKNQSSLSKNNVKQNTFRPAQIQANQSILSTVRKQILSVSKCPLGALPINPNGSSFEKLAPLNFQSRRI